MVVLRSTSGLHMGEFDGAEAIAALGFDRRSQQKAVFGDVNAHIRQFLGSGFLKNGSSKFRQTVVAALLFAACAAPLPTQHTPSNNRRAWARTAILILIFKN